MKRSTLKMRKIEIEIDRERGETAVDKAQKKD